MTRRSSRLRVGHAITHRGAPRSSDQSCPDCLRWQLRYLIAMDTGYYLAIRIQDRGLRDQVIEHLCVGWALYFRRHDEAATFGDFVFAYIRDVERDVDRKTKEVDWEYRRVWTNHALILMGEPEGVERRARG